MTCKRLVTLGLMMAMIPASTVAAFALIPNADHHSSSPEVGLTSTLSSWLVPDLVNLLTDLHIADTYPWETQQVAQSLVVDFQVLLTEGALSIPLVLGALGLAEPLAELDLPEVAADVNNIIVGLQAME